jgi:hypothetical protein
MRTSHYSIGEPIGSEKNDTEFKQVVIPIHFWNHFDEECADTFILTEKFDRAIRKTLEHYFTKYVPKYVASMSRTPGNKAKLFFGVSDDGIITGFPTLRGIEVDEISNMIKSTFSKMRGISNCTECNYVKKKFMDSIEIDIVDLKANRTPSNITKVVETALNYEVSYNTVMEEYHSSMLKWRTELEYYKSSLAKICNVYDHRTKLLQYCVENGAPDYITSILHSDEQISFEEKTVSQKKYDNTTMDYWVTNYKEFHGNRLRLLRPIRPTVRKYNDYLKTELSKLEVMNGNWKNDVKYQMIVLSFQMNTNPQEWIEYLKKGFWISSIRKTGPQGDPCCEKSEY